MNYSSKVNLIFSNLSPSLLKKRVYQSSIIAELEKRGVERPSTHAPIIDTLLLRQYILLNEQRNCVDVAAKVDNDLQAEISQFSTQLLRGLSGGHQALVTRVQDEAGPARKAAGRKNIKLTKPAVNQDEQCPVCKQEKVACRIIQTSKKR